MDAAYEKLGVFYLGRTGAGDGEPPAPLLYDSRDLTTHAVCVGMTGSGKTGLCVGLLEEAAIDGIPAIVIDPKGDLSNLLLTFPDLAPSDFRPWVSEDVARQKGITADELAAREAQKWSQGLREWDQDGDRIRRLRAAAEFALYTPGSEAVAPVSVLSSLDPPRDAGGASDETLRERALGVSSSLLSLVGVEADPLRSREHILLSTIIETTWREGRGLDIAGLIRAVQSPPVTRVGVMEVDTFFPEKERFELAMLLNNLIASPGFQGWMSGAALDVDRMLYNSDGKPRVAIFSIAHLDDTQRMFFVSLLLNEVVAWMRTRTGTPSLRALVYMDEIFGYLPPVGNPPSKQPLLTLMKQARAFGVGVVLATQNPVDLDYKALSNAGTWFIGRLQTERDKQRLADGLASAAGNLDAAALSATIGALESRAFLLHNVHDDAPCIFRTRWAMSYLAGPLTRAQLALLPGNAAVVSGAVASANAGPGVTPASKPATPAGAPLLPGGMAQWFVSAGAAGATYRASVLGEVRVHVAIPGGDVRTVTVVREATSDGTDGPDWTQAQRLDRLPAAGEMAPAGAGFGDLPAGAGKKGAAAAWEKSLADAIYREGFDVFALRNPRLTSVPGESERDFRVRIADALREARDGQVDRLREKYQARLDRLQDRIARAQTAVTREQSQAESARVQSAVSIGATVLSALFGRRGVTRTTIGKATTAARGIDRSARQQQDVGRAKDALEKLQSDYEALKRELDDEVSRIDAELRPEAVELDTRQLKPRKSDIEVTRVVILWRPA